MPSTSEAGAKAKAKRRKKKSAPLEIGWREWAELPALSDRRILAKMDTGAKTSAIHAYRIREVMRDGRLHAEFHIHPVQKKKRPEIFCSAPIHDRRLIRSSNGAIQERIVIVAVLRLGSREWPIDLSLANRDDMGFRLLIGRDALRKNVIIHPARSFLLGR